MKRIDYFKLLRESLEFAWKYKILWVFGFLIALFSGGGSGGSSGNANFSGSSNTSSKTYYKGESYFADIIEKLDNFIHSPYFWITLIAVIILILIMIVASWYFTRVSKIALINSVKCDLLGQEKNIKLSYLWKSSHKYLLKMLYFDLAMIVFLLPLILLNIITVLSFILFPCLGIAFFCLSMPVFFISILLISVIKNIGEKIIILENKSLIDSIKSAFLILKDNLKEFLLAWLTMLLPGCGFSIITGIISIFLILPLGMGLLLLFISPNLLLIGLGLSACFCILLVLIIAAIKAPFNVFSYAYWTKLLILIKGDELKDEKIEEGVIIKKRRKKVIKKRNS